MLALEALLLDLDGTLIDSKEDITASVHQVQRIFGFPPSPEAAVASFIGDGVGKLLERALPGAGAQPLREAVELFKKHYDAHCVDRTRLYPGVLETLERFRSKKLAVVTNKPARISRKIIEALGIGPYFLSIWGGDSTAHQKPHPGPLLEAWAGLGRPNPHRCLMVGDSSNDVLAGKAAGMPTCGILSNIGDPEALRRSGPDYLLLNFNELPRLFT